MAPPSAAPEAGITHRRVLRIALPIMLANATVPILGAVDTGVVGQLGEAAPIGAVGIGAIVLASVYWIFGFLRMGTSGLVAQAYGARDLAETGALLVRALMIGFAAGLSLIVLQLPLVAGAFYIAPATDEVEDLARGYLAIRIWGAPATIALYAVVGWLIALERTRGVLVLQLWMNGLNIVLDLWFVLGLGWGVNGVAVATLISEWTALALGLWLCREAFAGRAWRDWARVFDRARVKRMMQVNSDIMIRTIALQASFTSFIFIGAGFGDVTLAANQVLFQFLHIVSFALDGFAYAAQALVGQAVGAGSVRAMRRSGVVTAQWGMGAAVLIGVAFWVLGPWVLDIMARDPLVQAEGRIYLPWVVALAVVSLASYMFDGIFIGATASREMRNTMLGSALLYALALVVMVPALGNHGLWAALMVLNAARGISMAALYPGVERRAVR